MKAPRERNLRQRCAAALALHHEQQAAKQAEAQRRDELRALPMMPADIAKAIGELGRLDERCWAIVEALKAAEALAESRVPIDSTHLLAGIRHQVEALSDRMNPCNVLALEDERVDALQFLRAQEGQ